jgi:hypothetical protein
LLPLFQEKFVPVRSKIIIYLLGIVIFSSCSPAPPVPFTPTPNPVGEITPEAGYPYPPPAVGHQPPYPVETTPAQAAVPTDPQEIVEQLQTGLGAVSGTLLINRQPRPAASLYLADVIQDDRGAEMVASYDPANSPRAFTDSSGNFLYVNIPPGRYGLVLDSVIASYLLHYPDRDEPILITITAGEVTDIGDLDYDDLPLP